MKVLYIAGKILIILGSVELSAGKIKSYKELKYENIIKQSTEYTCGFAVLATLYLDISDESF